MTITNSTITEALADNGGPTWTHLPKEMSSPFIGNGDVFGRSEGCRTLILGLWREICAARKRTTFGVRATVGRVNLNAKWEIIMRTFVGMVLAVVMVLGGVVAQADETVHGVISLHGLDVWHAQCKSPKTHCMFAYICDDNQTTDTEVWQMTMTVLSPTGLFGASDVTAERLGGCNTAGVLLCRPGATVGAMKALITVTRPWPVFLPVHPTQYELNFGCFDKTMAVLPDAADTLTRIAHIQGI